MVNTVRQWTLLRPIRVVWRAHRVQRIRPVESREPKPKAGFLTQYCAMLEHQVDLMLGTNTQK